MSMMHNSDPFLVDLMSRVQNALGPDLRDEVAALLAANRARQVADLGAAPPGTDEGGGGDGNGDGNGDGGGGGGAAATLRDAGFHRLGRLLDTAAASRLRAHLLSRPVYAAHVPVYSDGVARSVDETRHHSDYGSYRLADILAAPGVLDLALRDDVVALASAYLGALPYIYSVHAWWTYPGGTEPARTHRIHRDQDDFRFLSLFVYLTDVTDAADGPTIYYRGSHRKDLLAAATVGHPDPAVRAAADSVGRIELFFPPRGANATRYDHALRRLLAPHEAVLTGPAGSGFIADTFGLHRGSPTAGRDRLALWIRYGLYRNWAYINDRTAPAALPAATLAGLTPAQRMMLELVARPQD